MPVISPHSKIIVTGANGYIGLWVVYELLKRGYSVHAAVRSTTKVETLTAILRRRLPEASDRLTGFVVPDITADQAFDEAMRGVEGVIHTASPVTDSMNTPEAYIEPAVNGVSSVLGSALRSKSVRRVVITGSIGGVANSIDPPPGVHTEDHWNDVAIQVVEEKGGDAPGIVMYDASKTLSERAAWAFMAAHEPEAHFDLCVINPSYTFGPVIDDTLSSPSALSVTPLLMYKMVFATPAPPDRQPKRLNYVDIRDVTEIHIRALEVEEAGGERIIVNSEVASWDDWLHAAARLGVADVDEPEVDREAVADESLAESDRPEYPFFANDKVKRIFGIKMRTVPDTMEGVVRDFRERGWLSQLAS
ncbi:NAD-P-binding protein [Trametes polyzona]|nr:NAD-P-binding protein [Trametes polyzona]